MNDILYLNFIDEEIEDVSEALLTWGVAGILEKYHEWLKLHGHLKD